MLATTRARTRIRGKPRLNHGYARILVVASTMLDSSTAMPHRCLSPRDAPPPELIAERLAAASPAILLLRLSGRVEIGSSTLVRIGGRFLLATAGHAVDDAADHEIRVVASGRTAAESVPFLRRSRRRRADADLAWIELAAETVASRGLGFVARDALGADGTPETERCFLVQGYPAERALAATREGFDLRAMGFVTTAAVARPGDVAVLYPPPDPASAVSTAPHPYGISGGGIWTCPRGAAAHAWQGATRLVGVARGWRPRRSTLYGTAIELWLARVEADFPDLRPALDRRRCAGS
jgi:hypothetical protein